MYGPPEVDELFLRYQEPDEIFPALDFLKQREPKNYLEVGSGAGVSLHCAMETFGKECSYRAIDAHQRPKHNLRLHTLVEAYLERGFDALLCKGFSQEEYAVAWAREHGPYDVILIDADHTFIPCLEDIRNYAPMLSEKGALVMHDTDRLGIEDGIRKRGFARPDCRHLWMAMKEFLPSEAIREFYTSHPKTGGRKGIGIVEAWALRK